MPNQVNEVTAQSLANQINAGHPNTYVAEVRDRLFRVNNPNGTGFQTLKQVDGNLLIRYLPEKTKNSKYFHTVSIDFAGELGDVTGDEVKVNVNELHFTIVANSGTIKLNADVTYYDILEKLMLTLTQRHGHIVHPPGSYCDIPIRYPIAWQIFNVPTEDRKKYVGFNIAGSGTIPVADIGVVAGIKDISELSKFVIGLVGVLEHPGWDDGYREAAGKGFIDDCYVKGNFEKTLNKYLPFLKGKKQ